MVRNSSVMACALFSTVHLGGPVPAPSKAGSGPRSRVHVSGCWTQVLRKEQTEHLGPQALWLTQGNQTMGRSFKKYDFKNAPWNLHKNVSTDVPWSKNQVFVEKTIHKAISQICYFNWHKLLGISTPFQSFCYQFDKNSS